MLKIDWASHEAAKYACENWHYSKSIPFGKSVKIGAWENNKFIGAVIFAQGTNKSLVTQYGLTMHEGCELCRVAFTKHKTPISKILSIAIKFLKKSNPKLKLLVSFADTAQNHIGIVYQASNWLYLGSSKSKEEYFIDGKWTHCRQVHDKYGCVGKKFLQLNPHVKTRPAGIKHKYVYLLSNDIKLKFMELKKPYPKCVESSDSAASKFHLEEGSASLTSTLQLT